MTTNPTNAWNVPDDVLAAALRAQAAGYLTSEAAVELLIEQRWWLDHRGFVSGYIDYQDDPDIVGDTGPLARVRWAEAIKALDSSEFLRSSDSAELVLRIAASLGGGVPVDLRENATNSLGHAHAQWVVDAIRHATGGDDR